MQIKQFNFFSFVNYREILTVKTVTLYEKFLFFFIKSLKSKKRKLTLALFIMSFKKYGWAIQKDLFA